MYLLCHGVAVVVGLSHFLIWLVIGYLSPLFFIPFCFKMFSAFIRCLSVPLQSFLFSIFSVYPPLSADSISFSFCLFWSASACTSVSICLHDCTFSILPSQIPLCLSSSDNLPGEVRRWLLQLSQSHPDTWVKPGRTTLKITW